MTGRLRVLSPFDPALRDRARAEFLFGFRYRIEVFVPEPKRVFGYYVFPLLEGDRLVGRIDVKRAGAVLAVRAVWPEAGVVFGLSLSVASTVVSLRNLQDRRVIQTERGKLTVGWLVVEDVAMVLAMVLLPTSSSSCSGSITSTACGTRAVHAGSTLVSEAATASAACP